MCTCFLMFVLTTYCGFYSRKNTGYVSETFVCLEPHFTQCVMCFVILSVVSGGGHHH
uniref:Uncharacterized protein n=1 Tax=Anguilla anguilla TaxID=7936 RepID=A0A0E9TH44_ANGAN